MFYSAPKEIGNYKISSGTKNSDLMRITGKEAGFSGAGQDVLEVYTTYLDGYKSVGLMSGGSDNDTYIVKSGSYALIADLGGGVDTVIVSDVKAKDVYYSTIGGPDGDILATDGHTGIIFIDPFGKKNSNNKIESIQLADGTYTFSQLADILQRSGKFLGNTTYEILNTQGILSLEKAGLNPSKIDYYIANASYNSSLVGEASEPYASKSLAVLDNGTLYPRIATSPDEYKSKSKTNTGTVLTQDNSTALFAIYDPDKNEGLSLIEKIDQGGQNQIILSLYLDSAYNNLWWEGQMRWQSQATGELPSTGKISYNSNTDSLKITRGSEEIILSAYSPTKISTNNSPTSAGHIDANTVMGKLSNDFAKNLVRDILTGNPQFTHNSYDAKFYNLGGGRYGVQQKGKSSIDEITGATSLQFQDQAISLTSDVAATFNQVKGIDDVSGVVFRLYNAAFARLPDANGLENWINANKTGGQTYASSALEFAKSQEFKNRYGSNISDTQYVTTLYNNVLGRDPDAGGLAHYQGLLASGKDRGSLLLDFSESPENRTLFTKVTGLS